MFTRGIIQNTEDYFKELNQRPDKCIYFYRMNGYNDKCRQFIGEYAKEARKSGVVIEGKIANPTEQNLSYYEEIMGMDFIREKMWQQHFTIRWMQCEKRAKTRIC